MTKSPYFSFWGCRPPRRGGGNRAALAFAFATFLIAAAAPAQEALDLTRLNPAAVQLARQELAQVLRKKMPGQPPAAIERAGREFLKHLAETSPIIAETFAAGRMSEDDLASRLDVFFGDHPEFTGQSARTGAVDPRQRVAKLLQDAPDLARTEPERRALADRFIERLGDLSGTARTQLMAGRMPQDELQSRVSVFVTDLRTDAARVRTDPAVAAVPSIVDAYIKANFGSATDRANSICYRGVVEENTVRREFVLFKKRPRLLRVHIVKDGFVVGVMGFDGTAAWTESPGRLPVAAVGREGEMLANWSRFDDPLVGYSERGADVRLKDRPANGPVQLDIRESDGTEMIAAIDPASYKEVSLRIRRTDGKWRELRFRDYRRVGPVNVAYLQEEWDGGALRSTTRFSQLTLDPGLLDRFFARPTAMAFDFMDFMGGLAVWEYREKRSAATTAPPLGLAR